MLIVFLKDLDKLMSKAAFGVLETPSSVMLSKCEVSKLETKF